MESWMRVMHADAEPPSVTRSIKKKGIDRHEHADDNDSWDARALA
jgi:hypothetical protein